MNTDATAPPATSPDRAPLLAGVEAGGTKIVCAIASDPLHPLREIRVPTGDPEATLDRIVAFFRESATEFGPLQAMGIGTFGPAGIDPASPCYGSILTTPKPGWTGFPFLERVRAGLAGDFPIVFETDVNAAVVGEHERGAARTAENVAYITVGTGIGGAFLHRGEPIHGRMHPEIGHLVVPDLDAEFGKGTNVCPFHGSCLEGRASGPSVEARWGLPGHEIPEDHPAWDLEARYLAIACVNLTAAWSPDVIVFGGGVSAKTGLIEKIRREFSKLSGGYWELPSLDGYIREASLGQGAGIVGALVLAQKALRLSRAG